jgi:hypothetical protein
VAGGAGAAAAAEGPGEGAEVPSGDLEAPRAAALPLSNELVANVVQWCLFVSFSFSCRAAALCSCPAFLLFLLCISLSGPVNLAVSVRGTLVKSVPRGAHV